MAIVFPQDIYPRSESWELVNNKKVFKSPLAGYKQTKITPVNRWKVDLVFEDLTNEETKKLQAFIYALRGGAESALLGPFGRPVPLNSNFSSTLSFTAAKKVTSTGSISSGKILSTAVSGEVAPGDILEIYSPTSAKGLYKCLSNQVALDKTVDASSVSFNLYDPFNKLRLHKSGSINSTNAILSPGDYLTINSELKVVTEEVNLSTESVVPISPPLRNRYVAGDSVNVYYPKIEMRLIGNETIAELYGVEYNGKLSLSFLEAS